MCLDRGFGAIVMFIDAVKRYFGLGEGFARSFGLKLHHRDETRTATTSKNLAQPTIEIWEGTMKGIDLERTGAVSTPYRTVAQRPAIYLGQGPTREANHNFALATLDNWLPPSVSEQKSRTGWSHGSSRHQGPGKKRQLPSRGGSCTEAKQPENRIRG